MNHELYNYADACLMHADISDYLESYVVEYKELPDDPEVHYFSCEACNEYDAVEQCMAEMGEHVIVLACN